MKQKIYDIQIFFLGSFVQNDVKILTSLRQLSNLLLQRQHRLLNYNILMCILFMLIVEFLMKLNEKIRQKTKDMSCFNKTKEEHFFI